MSFCAPSITNRWTVIRAKKYFNALLNEQTIGLKVRCACSLNWEGCYHRVVYEFWKYTTILPLVVLYAFIEVEEQFAIIMFRVAQEVFMGHSEDGASEIGRIKSSDFDLFNLWSTNLTLKWTADNKTTKRKGPKVHSFFFYFTVLNELL